MQAAQYLLLASDEITAIETGSATSASKVVPFHCELIAVAFHVNKLIATGGAGAAHTFDIMVNAVDSTINVGIPETTAADTGVLSAPSAKTFFNAGDAVHLESNNEQVTGATDAWWTMIVKPIEVTRDERNTYLDMPSAHTGIQVLNATSPGVVVPERSVITGCWVWTDDLILTSGVAGTLQEIVINGTDKTVGFLVPETLAANTGTYISLAVPLLVEAGDEIALKSDGEQVAATDFFETIVIEPA